MVGFLLKLSKTIGLLISSLYFALKMLESWVYTFISVFVVSLISLVGIGALLIRGNNLKKILLFFVSFAAGALLGDAFIHLLPEAIEKNNGIGLNISLYFLLGIIMFFILEKFIHWRHCHIPTSESHPHPVAFMNIIGDGLHNLLDGMVIAGSYVSSIPLGITTTIAVVAHEIPQEIGDFGVLVHAGFSRMKALFFNFISALTAVLGAVIALVAGSGFGNFAAFIVPLTAGGFIYIAGSDLIPELHKEVQIQKSFFQLIGILFGIGVMLLLLLLE